LYFQALFMLDQVKAAAPRRPEWKNDPAFKALMARDYKAMLLVVTSSRSCVRCAKGTRILSGPSVTKKIVKIPASPKIGALAVIEVSLVDQWPSESGKAKLGHGFAKLLRHRDDPSRRLRRASLSLRMKSGTDNCPWGQAGCPRKQHTLRPI
jgi:hypothetical protein